MSKNDTKEYIAIKLCFYSVCDNYTVNIITPPRKMSSTITQKILNIIIIYDIICDYVLEKTYYRLIYKQKLSF